MHKSINIPLKHYLKNLIYFKSISTSHKCNQVVSLLQLIWHGGLFFDENPIN